MGPAGSPVGERRSVLGCAVTCGWWGAPLSVHYRPYLQQILCVSFFALPRSSSLVVLVLALSKAIDALHPMAVTGEGPCRRTMTPINRQVTVPVPDRLGIYLAASAELSFSTFGLDLAGPVR